MIIPNISGKIKNGNQTTNQYYICIQLTWSLSLQSDDVSMRPGHQAAAQDE